MAIVKARYAKTGSTVIAGVTHGAYAVKTTTRVESGGAGAPGRKGAQVTYKDITVTLYGEDVLALLAQVAQTKASIVIGYVTGAGVNRKKTFKNVVFTEVVKAGDVPRRDSGGKVARFGILGHCCWLSTDTLALMIKDEGDA